FNSLGGILPYEISRLANLQFLQFGSNNLSTEIHSSVFNLLRISVLRWRSSNLPFLVGVNGFSGAIPPSLSNISSLQIIDPPDNRFSGTVPNDFSRILNLPRLNVGRNILGRGAPDELDFINSLRNCSKFQMLGIDSSRFSGLFPIPLSYGNLTQLFELRLDANKLLLNLFGNNLSGFMPAEIFTLSSLTVSFNLARNFLSGTLLMEVGNFLNLKEFDLSDNEVSGGIPGNLGRCLSMEQIYVQHNLLSGLIPLSFSSLKGIQDIDMPENNFTGSVPKFLQDFVFPRYLNLSFDHFKGEVPKYGILANRSGFSQDGNTELCGGSIELALPVCDVCNLQVRANFSSVYKGVLSEDGNTIAVK
ncbi:hypothetical protein MIMGU_mgv1a022924mg, partial [Erythranthe guttata]